MLIIVPNITILLWEPFWFFLYFHGIFQTKVIFLPLSWMANRKSHLSWDWLPLKRQEYSMQNKKRKKMTFSIILAIAPKLLSPTEPIICSEVALTFILRLVSSQVVKISKKLGQLDSKWKNAKNHLFFNFFALFLALNGYIWPFFTFLGSQYICVSPRLYD